MKREDLFEPIDPPPGGLAALRERLDSRSPRRRFVPLLALAGAAAAVVLFFVLGRPRTDVAARARTHVDTSEVALGLAPMPSDRVAIADDARGTTALIAVPTKDPNVSFYWVQSTEWGD
ncbi:MAG TPA: hypothetical protein VIF62_37370 [Labilithrix sp.]|jgi:hypothetical protein